MISGNTSEKKLSDKRTELPFGWKYPQLQELVSIKYGKGLPTKNLVKSGYPVFGANGIIGFHKEYLYEDEQVLISCRGAYSGKINWSLPKCFVTNNSLVLEVPEGCEGLRKYLFYALQAIDKSKLVTGSAQPQVTINNAEVLRIPLAPKWQQPLIVAEIEKQFSRLDEAVANLKRIKANLKRYKAAVLKAAVEGKLTETWRKAHPDVEPASKLLDRILIERRTKWKGKYKEPTAPPLTPDLPSLPKGWTWATVDQLASPEPNSITDGPFGSNLKTQHYQESGPRVIRLQNIGDGVFVNEKAHITAEHFARLKKHQIFSGDLVIAALGENPPRSCQIPPSVGNAIVKADCIRFKPHKLVLALFLKATLNSEPTRQRTKGIVHGVGRPRLNLGEIKSILVPLPSLLEQQAIVAEVERRLSVIEELEANVEANLTRATRFRQAILSKAFTGQLGNGVGKSPPNCVFVD